ncbi:hypothetical protein ASPWEDRAFT_306076 [Aspergillus wentii DTO 134E9]|uniref:RING-type domain-containing protein n=1 Tax=Aspergillus wentii DTO 134E9 TaxID=1073089 RepID=A0A1L9R3V7_ASPWE|nr:uncharacterized protein ASPWEDRAFT_306076 [Aspergillus wentii DTO 134E9]OJJ29605.1 hypothetical protein ASPWEDRAFT_306076 [Aspergillus wentii DTO 134E9]
MPYQRGSGPSLCSQENRRRPRFYQIYELLERELATLWQNNIHLHNRCQELQFRVTLLQNRLDHATAEWSLRYHNAARDRTNTICQGCHVHVADVRLSLCFHLLCRGCYSNQGPEAGLREPPGPSAFWTCKACCTSASA